MLLYRSKLWIVVAVGFLVVTFSVVIIVPRVARRAVDSRIDALANRLDVSVMHESLSVSIRRGLVISGISVTDAAGALLVSADRASVRVRWGRLLSFRFPFDDAVAEMVRVHPHPELEGMGLTASEIAMDDQQRISIRNLVVGPPGAGNRLLEAEHVELLFDRLPGSATGFELREVITDGFGVTAIREADGVTDVERLLAKSIDIARELWRSARRIDGELLTDTTDRHPEPIARSIRRVLPGRVHLKRGRISLEDRSQVHGGATADQIDLSIAELHISMDRVDGYARIESEGELRADGASGGNWYVEQQYWFRDGVIDGEITVTDIDLALLAQFAGGRLTPIIHSGVLNAHLRAERSGADILSTTMTGEVSLHDGTLNLPAVAAERIKLAPIDYRFLAQLDSAAALPPTRLVRPLPVGGAPISATPGGGVPSVDGLSLSEARGALVFEQGRLAVGATNLSFRPSIRGFGRVLGNLFDHGISGGLPARIELQIDLPETRLQTILDSIPAALLGDLRHLVVDGTIAWSFDLEVPTDQIARMQWRSVPRLKDFSVVSIPPAVDVFRLAGPFIHRITDPDVEYDRTVLVPSSRLLPAAWLTENAGLTGEQIDRLRSTRVHRTADRIAHRFDRENLSRTDPRYRFVPLGSISPFLVRAILTGEDGDFFHHDGVNWNSVRRAIDRNVGERGFVVGASTISMQLVKNLFLSHDRLIARKFQEVLLVFLMEHGASLSKERIFEIYLNIIEFGPGVYGINDAARYYFAGSPAQLSVSESVWLASIVPNPKRFHYYYRVGEISDGWFIRMTQYYEVMHLRGRITTEQYQNALLHRPLFHRPDSDR